VGQGRVRLTADLGNIRTRTNGNKPNSTVIKSPYKLGGALTGRDIYTDPTGRVVAIGEDPSTDALKSIGNFIGNLSRGEFWLTAGTLGVGILLVVISVNGLIKSELIPRVEKPKAYIRENTPRFPRARKRK